MLPPLSSTTVRPVSRTAPDMIAATPTAPAASTTSLARSSRTSSARAVSSSETVTMSSTRSRMIGKFRSPGRATAMPSEIVGFVVMVTGLAGGDRRRVGRSVLSLHADDPDLPSEPLGHALHGECDAGDDAAATDRHHDGVDVRHLVDDLEAERALPGDHCRVVERRDEHGAGVGGEVLRGAQRFFHGVAAQHDVGSVVAGGLQLGQSDPDRREDRRGDAELAGGEGNTLRVVAGARGDDALGTLLGGQGREAVVGAAHLVGTRALQVLALQVHRRPEQLGEELRRLHRGDACDALDGLARRLDVRERRDRGERVRGGAGVGHSPIIVVPGPRGELVTLSWCWRCLLRPRDPSRRPAPGRRRRPCADGVGATGSARAVRASASLRGRGRSRAVASVRSRWW